MFSLAKAAYCAAASNAITYILAEITKQLPQISFWGAINLLVSIFWLYAISKLFHGNSYDNLLMRALKVFLILLSVISSTEGSCACRVQIISEPALSST